MEFLRADIADASVMHKVAECGIVVNLAAICTPARYMKEATAVGNLRIRRRSQTLSAASGAWFIHFPLPKFTERLPRTPFRLKRTFSVRARFRAFPAYPTPALRNLRSAG